MRSRNSRLTSVAQVVSFDLNPPADALELDGLPIGTSGEVHREKRGPSVSVTGSDADGIAASNNKYSLSPKRAKNK